MPAIKGKSNQNCFRNSKAESCLKDPPAFFVFPHVFEYLEFTQLSNHDVNLLYSTVVLEYLEFTQLSNKKATRASPMMF